SRGDANSLTTYLRDLEGLTRQVFLPESGGSRAIVYGHSFGGLLAIHWALARHHRAARPYDSSGD
ncbi:MAG: alpha/beta hydrolase, partial [Planctomycetes bacterium]|nr:alpha/beta hydrolase [Planctomycetota bacterium]